MKPHHLIVTFAALVAGLLAPRALAPVAPVSADASKNPAVASQALQSSIPGNPGTLPDGRGSVRVSIVGIDPPEEGFYAKRLDYEGILIKAPTNVVDEALFAARDRLSMMLGNLPGVRVSLSKAGAELHIIGRDQVTTDLPEWRQDKGKPLTEYNGLTRDERTRGMGGLLASCGEENLLKLEKDRYRGRDICVHEFAHNILQHGAASAVREKVRGQRRRSLERGLWTGSYAGSNDHEFFAELSMWYFGTHGDLHMKDVQPKNGREGLKAYDPEAYALLDEFYSGRMEALPVGESARVALAIGATDLPVPKAEPPRPRREFTFIATSDVHYDAFENEDRNDRVRETLRAMNAATNLAWPEALGGGAIERPRGVLVLGDVIDDGDRIFQGKHQTPRQFYQFAADFGLDGADGLLNYPVFETWGNHDGPPLGQEKFGFSFQARLRDRNVRRQTKGWLTDLSTNALHYSWDWDDVHFVMLGLYPADAQNPLVKRYSPVWHDPQGALTFLREDLERHVGRSGRPVVLLSHCGFDTDWWHTNDWRAAYQAARPYNVVLYFYGHTGTGLRKWAPEAASPPLDCVNTGQAEKGFFIVQFSGERVRLAYRFKRTQEEKLPEGKRRVVWDGTWNGGT